MQAKDTKWIIARTPHKNKRQNIWQDQGVGLDLNDMFQFFFPNLLDF